MSPTNTSLQTLSEIVPEYSQWLSAWTLNPSVHPDTLASRHSDGLEIYHTMYTRDPYVRDGVENLIQGVLQTDWDVLPVDNSQGAETIAAFVEWVLLHQNYEAENGAVSQLTNQTVFEQMLQCVVYGFSLTELIWIYEKIPGFSSQGNYRLVLKPRTPWNITFDLDRFGNLRPDGVMTTVEGVEKRLHWKNRLLIMPYKPDAAAWPYGNSLLRPVYRAYYLLDMLWRLRGMHLQKQAAGVKIAHYPKSATVKQIEDFKSQCRRLTVEGFMVIPERFDVLFQSGPTDGEAFRTCLHDLKTEISQAITGQSLAGIEGFTGTRAQAQVHKETWMVRVEYLRWLLSDVINGYVIPLIVRYNFGQDKRLPVFRFQREE